MALSIGTTNDNSLPVIRRMGRLTCAAALFATLSLSGGTAFAATGDDSGNIYPDTSSSSSASAAEDTSSSSTDENATESQQTDTQPEPTEQPVVVKPTTTLETPQLTSKGLSLAWSTTGDATSYRIYRKSDQETKYAKIASLEAGEQSYQDIDIEPATTYRYYIRTYYQAESKVKSVKSATVKLDTYLATPSITAVTKKASKTTMKLTWTLPEDTEASALKPKEYRIDYSTDRLFRTKQTVSVNGSKSTTKITGLEKKKLYYVRIRAYANTGKTQVYSRPVQSQTAESPADTSTSLLTKKVTETTTTWKTVKKVKKKKIKKKNGKTTWKTVYKTVKKNGKTKKVKVYTKTRKKIVTKTKKDILFEIRSQAGQELYGYDTLQGATSDGTYLYYVLYNRIYETLGKPCCLIAKFKASNLKLTKLSAPLDIDHGNSLTYDSANKRLVAAHCKTHTARLSYISPKTLKITSYVDAADPLVTANAASVSTSLNLSAITYCAERKQYVAFETGKKGFVVYDESMKPIRRITPSLTTKQVSQTVLATPDYILLGVSPKSGVEGGNQLLIYDWDGNYVSAIQLGSTYELESAYFYQGHLYVGFYAAYYPAAGSGESISRNNYIALVNGI